MGGRADERRPISSPSPRSARRCRFSAISRASKERVHAALQAFSAADGTAFAAVDASTAATDEAAAGPTDDSTTADVSAQELDTFNNDVRLRALKTLAEALAPIQQKKAILYFSAGMQRNGTDNQVELRAAVNAAVRANVAIYPVDARGLQAVVPGGSARQGSRGGLGAFTGSAVANQFSTLAAQQETLTTLASDTGGTAFLDTNDFGEAFGQVTKDISSYYILGFASTNGDRDGRFRRITVRLRSRPDLKVEAREGYYADRDFAHTAKGDREAAAAGAADDADSGDRRADVRHGRLVPARGGQVLRADFGRGPGFGRSGRRRSGEDHARRRRRHPRRARRSRRPHPRHDDGAAVGADGLAARQVLYQTGVTLPPGAFLGEDRGARELDRADGHVRDDDHRARAEAGAGEGQFGRARHAAAERAGGRKTASPLVRDGVELVPNLTHIVSRTQKLYFYYEVYDPRRRTARRNCGPASRSTAASVKVFETPIVERTQIDAADRRAAIFQFEVPAGSLTPGLYTCQINIIDEVAGRFAFPRLEMYVR